MEVATNDTTNNSTAWAALVLGAIGIYFIFRKNNKKVDNSELDSKNIDSFSKFRKTPLGKSIDEQLDKEGIELSDSQIRLLDECLQGLREKDYQVIEKASQFIKREDIYKALSKEEMKIFLPVRQKIVDCLDETLTP